jgi:raffinose/stachyose/melibiose transport system substrate-binding protein
MRPHLPRRVPALLLCGSLALAATACTVGGSADAGAAGSGQKKTLVVAEWTNPSAIEATKKINAIFEKEHPGVTVKLENAPTAAGAWGTLTNSLLSAKSVDILAQFAPTPAKFPPAETGLKSSGAAALITAGQITDLSGQDFMKSYDPVLQKYGVGYNNGIHGVVAAEYIGHGAVWYKKDLLDKYGVKVPTTYSEFVAALKKFKDAGKTPIFVAGKDGLQGIVYGGAVQQLLMKGHGANDSTAVSDQRAKDFWAGTKTWNDPIYKEAATKYTEVMQYIEPAASGVAQLTAPGVWAAKSDDFPFFLDGSWDGNTIKEANPDLKFGFFVMPATDDTANNRVPVKADLTWMVPTWAPNKDLAMDWLRIFSRPENYKLWLDATGSMSTQPGVTSSTLPWMDWLNEHSDQRFAALTDPWIPAGAPPEAAGPDLTKMTPFGKQSIDAALTRAAAAYRKSVGK